VPEGKRTTARDERGNRGEAKGGGRREEKKRSVNEPTDHTPALPRGTPPPSFPSALLLDEFLHTGRGT